MGATSGERTLAAGARPEDDEAELTKKLSNPAASLISAPLQNNYDCCSGPSDAHRYTLNIQPFVQPFFSYTYPHITTLSLNTEASYNRKTDQQSVPLHSGSATSTSSASGGPEWGLRVAATFLVPEWPRRTERGAPANFRRWRQNRSARIYRCNISCYEASQRARRGP